MRERFRNPGMIRGHDGMLSGLGSWEDMSSLGGGAIAHHQADESCYIRPSRCWSQLLCGSTSPWTDDAFPGFFLYSSRSSRQSRSTWRHVSTVLTSRPAPQAPSSAQGSTLRRHTSFCCTHPGWNPGYLQESCPAQWPPLEGAVKET
jgi:hypothetical protein